MLRERLIALFARYEVTFVPIIMNIMLFENAALDFGWHELTLRPRTGEPTLFRRKRYMELWQRRGDSAWGIVLFIDNVDHPSVLVEDMIQTIRRDGIQPPTVTPRS